MPINPGDYVAYTVPPPHGRGMKTYVHVLRRLPALQFEVDVPRDPQRPNAPTGALIVPAASLDENDKLPMRYPANERALGRDLRGRYAYVALPGTSVVNEGAGFFRGDDRDPLIVYAMGFRTRQLHAAPIFRARIPQAGNVQVNQFDIDPESGICLTGRPGGAAIFPLKKAGVSVDHTFLYVVYPRRFIRTYKIQQQARKAYDANDVLQHIDRLAFAREAVVPTNHVPGDRIVGCYRVARNWLGSEWSDGLTVVVGHFKPNPDFVHRHHARYNEFLQIVDERVRQIPQQLGPF